MSLTRFVYYSERNPAVTLDVRALLATCHRNNAPRNITGFLYYNGAYFLQCLEGGRAEVNATYHRIVADQRHLNILLLSAADCRERLFGTWSMGVQSGVDERARKIMLRYLPSETFDPETTPVEALVDVLQDFAAEL